MYAIVGNTIIYYGAFSAGITHRGCVNRVYTEIFSSNSDMSAAGDNLKEKSAFVLEKEYCKRKGNDAERKEKAKEKG